MLDDVGHLAITRLWQACAQEGLDFGGIWRCGGKGASIQARSLDSEEIRLDDQKSQIRSP